MYYMRSVCELPSLTGCQMLKVIPEINHQLEFVEDSMISGTTTMLHDAAGRNMSGPAAEASFLKVHSMFGSGVNTKKY